MCVTLSWMQGDVVSMLCRKQRICVAGAVGE